MDLRPPFILSTSVKMLINIGCLFDIPTGHYLKGKHGESILNGGLGTLTGIAGIGNSFKSTILHYMMLSAFAKVFEAPLVNVLSYLSTYDTEINIHEHTLKKFASRFKCFADKDIIKDGLWQITDKNIYYANKWFEITKENLKLKKTNIKKIEVESPFLDRDGKTLIRVAIPTFGEIDSFTEFETEDVAAIRNNNEIGESGGNTQHMRQGLSKSNFLIEVPALMGGANHYLGFTAQIGKELVMASGPMPVAPIKKLQHLKNGDKLKGVTDKFTFLMNNCWHAYNALPLINQGTKGPEYPRYVDDNSPGDMDLNIVSLRQLRSKSGPSGIVLNIIVSQSEGVLPSLTEFHFIKEMERYGLSGTLQHYSLDLLPDVKLSRTTVRSKIEADEKLRRALNITAELCQMSHLWHHIGKDTICTPKQLYDDLKAKGYDWDVLLSTRGWYTFNNDSHPIPYLSTWDLLLMRKGEYHPYWMKPRETITV